MEKMDFPKGTKPREIFVYTCERIAEPLIPLGYKYRKSKNDIYKKDGIFVFSFYFSPSIRFGSTTFTAFFDVSSPVIAQWRSEQEGTEETYDGIVGTSIARLTHRYDDFPRYEVSTLLERERSIRAFLDENDDCIDVVNEMIEDGTLEADGKISEDEFVKALFVNNVTIFVNGSETGFYIDLDAEPDYFMGHLVCIEVDCKYKIEVGGFNG